MEKCYKHYLEKTKDNSKLDYQTFVQVFQMYLMMVNFGDVQGGINKIINHYKL